MKVVKGILSSIIGISLFAIIFALSFVYILRGILKDDVFGTLIENKVLTEYSEEESKDAKRAVEELIGKNEVSELAGDIIDEYIKYTKDENYEVSDEIVDKIVEFCVANRKTIARISKEEVTEEKIRSDETRTNIKKSLNEVFPEIKKDIGENGDKILFVYNLLTGKLLKLSLFFAIVFLIVLLALINLSVYKWLTTFGITLIVSGIIYTSLYVLLMAVKEEVLRELNLDINLTPTIIIIIGGVELVFGILSIIIKRIIDRMNIKVEENYNM